MGANSVSVKPGSLASRNNPLTMIFVVVKSVAMPPRMVPNANGMSNFDGETFERRATPDNDGNNNDAAAMLFIKSESTADAVITPKINRRSPLPNNLMMIRTHTLGHA